MLLSRHWAVAFVELTYSLSLARSRLELRSLPLLCAVLMRLCVYVCCWRLDQKTFRARSSVVSFSSVAPRVSHFVVRAATPQQQENYNTYIHTTEKLGFLIQQIINFNFIAIFLHPPARFLHICIQQQQPQIKEK